jgi:predicted lipoprotein with Yx(FWY)xxD motif
MRTKVGFAAAAMLVLGLTACSGAGGSGDAAASHNKPVNVQVKVSKSTFGEILTDEKNRTLYAFTKDKDGTSACGDDCIATWPALTASKATAGDGLDKGLLKNIDRTEGAKQAAYGDWPLYYYVGDANPGEVNGQGVDGEWFVVRPDGKLIKSKS